MSGGKTKRATQKKNGKYSKQFDRTAANKKRIAERHKNNHPNDVTKGGGGRNARD